MALELPYSQEFNLMSLIQSSLNKDLCFQMETDQPWVVKTVVCCMSIERSFLTEEMSSSSELTLSEAEGLK